MMEQIGIALTGVVAIWLANDTDPTRRRYACLFGLAGQPFWMYSAFTASQWGILLLTFFYTAGWWRGVRSQWL